MWIFLKDAFLSIVDKDVDDDSLLVRARVAGDIERVFPGAKVTESPRNDYRYRAKVRRKAVGEALAAAVESIDYPNFKATVKEDDRHDAYLGVWQVLYRWQAERARRPGVPH